MLNIFKFVVVLFLGVISCACVNTVAVHELNQKAAEYIESGDVNSAISRLEASIDLDGNIYESRYNLAVAYMQVGKCDKALENIKVAVELEKKEPAVYYTEAVSAMCVADSLFETKDENGEKILKEFSSKDEEKNVSTKYIALLNEANTAFETYLKLSQNSEESQDIYRIIKDNEDKISAKKSEFNIE